MGNHTKLLYDSLNNWLTTFWFELRTALSAPFAKEDVPVRGDRGIDSDFEGWLHGDPTVTKNPASRYGERTPGYITGNGLGSMEIGAADD